MDFIRFNYIYRDGANFKSWGEVIFANSSKILLKEMEARLLHAFLPDGQFIAHQIGIPEVFLFHSAKMTFYDHCFHEFFSLESCKGPSTDFFNRPTEKFLNDVEKAASKGWIAFDIHERL